MTTFKLNYKYIWTYPKNKEFFDNWQYEKWVVRFAFIFVYVKLNIF